MIVSAKPNQASHVISQQNNNVEEFCHNISTGHHECSHLATEIACGQQEDDLRIFVSRDDKVREGSAE